MPSNKKAILLDESIKKVSAQVNPDYEVYHSASYKINTIVTKLAKKIIKEAVRESKKLKGIQAIHIQDGMKHVINGELAKHALCEGTKTVTKFNTYDGNIRDESHGLVIDTLLVGGLARATLHKIDHNKNIKEVSIIYLAAVMEYIMAELLELSGNSASDSKSKHITKTHVLNCIHRDEELMVLYTTLGMKINPKTLDNLKYKQLENELDIMHQEVIDMQYKITGYKREITRIKNMINGMKAGN